jgi:hypothetical protein
MQPSLELIESSYCPPAEPRCLVLRHIAGSAGEITGVQATVGMDISLGFISWPIVAAAITAERLAPAGVHVAKTTGVLAASAGLFLIARAVF